MKLNPRYRRLSMVRIALLFGWCMLCYELSGCPCPLFAQEPLESNGFPTRRRQSVRNGSVVQEPQTPVTLVVDQNVSPPQAVPSGNEEKEGRTLPPPVAEPGEEILPINLPTALRLANAQAWDIAIASQQLRIASAELSGANVLWVPSIIGGLNYTYHAGPVLTTISESKTVNGNVSDASYSSLYPGMAPLAFFATTDAIFSPLAQRQVVRAQRANVQTATNDTLVSLAVTYFQAVEARADLAAIEDIVQRMQELVRKTTSLAPQLVPELEVARVSAAMAAAEEARETARQRWRVASAEVARLVRLKPTVLVVPLEPPQLQLTLVPPDRTLEDLVPVAVRSRPELAYNQAQVEAAQHRLSQEKWRPFLPFILGRGSGPLYPYPMAFGTFGGGVGGDLTNFGLRSDWDVEAIWEWKNLGFGNLALIRERRAAYERARIQAFKVRDIVAKEVTETWAELQSARNRIDQAERELQQAQISADKNLKGLGESKRVAGNIRELVIRPLEVVAALQELSKAYYNYFGSIADYNRYQFRLYRALGSPAQMLTVDDPSNPLTGPR